MAEDELYGEVAYPDAGTVHTLSFRAGTAHIQVKLDEAVKALELRTTEDYYTNPDIPPDKTGMTVKKTIHRLRQEMDVVLKQITGSQQNVTMSRWCDSPQ